MITKVNPKFLMGKVMPDDTFFRVNQKSEMPYHDRVLKYGCGLYFVFKTESTNTRNTYKMIGNNAYNVYEDKIQSNKTPNVKIEGNT